MYLRQAIGNPISGGMLYSLHIPYSDCYFVSPIVLQLLLDLADDFVEEVANFAAILAKHRDSNTIDVQDLQLHLGRNE